MGQQVLAYVGAVVGGVIGAYAGGNVYLGASIGFAIGGGVGSLIFPTKIDGPHTLIAQTQLSQYGAMLRIAFGNARLPGNIFWQLPIQEVGTSQGGKGGPSVTSYAYYGTFAAALCEGPIAGIRRIWANGILIYDVSNSAAVATIQASNDLAANHLTVYLGSTTQNPDPTMQAALGVGNVPAYRGTAYLVFRSIPLQTYGNILPSINVDVFSSTSTSLQIANVFENDTGADGTFHHGNSTGNGDPSLMPIISSITPQLRVANRTPFIGSPSGDGFVYLYDVSTGNNIGLDVPNGWEGSIPLSMWQGTPFASPYISPVMVFPDGQTAIYVNATFSVLIVASLGIFSQRYDIYPVLVKPPAGTSGAGMRCIAPCADRTNICVILSSYDGGTNTYSFTMNIVAVSADTPPFVVASSSWSLPAASLGIWSNFAPGSTALTGWAVLGSVDGGRCMMESDHAHLWTFDPFGSGLIVLDLTQTPPAQLLASGQSAGTKTEAFPNDPGTLGAATIWADNGLCYMVTGPRIGCWRRNSVVIAQVALSTIVNGICERSGLQIGQINSTALTDGVWGFVIDRQMTARAAFEAIAPAWWFDAVESDGLLKFVHRSATPVATITLDDMGADTAGKVSTAPLEFTRGSEIELPSEISLTYYALGSDYQPGVQYARRVSGIESNNVQNVDSAAVMDDDQAAIAVAVIMWDSIAGRVSFKFSTGYKFAQYEPTDIWNIQTTNETYLARLTSKKEGAGKIDWEATACAPVYDQVAAGGAITASQEVTGKLPTTALVLDIAPLRDSDGATTNLYVAMYGPSGWPGATLFKSSDSGATFVAGISMGTPSTAGSAVTALGNWTGGNIFDEGNIVDVVVLSPGETLASAAELTVLNGGNVALIGNEILQFKNAVLISANRYRLSGFLRGRFSTEWAMVGHGVGDRFVLLTGVLGLQTTPTSDIGQVRIYEAITSSQPLGSGTQQNISEAGRTLICFSPVLLFGTNDGSPGDIRLRWTRRNRITWQWLESVDVPMSEASEAYLVSIFNAAGTVVLRTISVSGTGVQNATYTGAQQTTDFGAPLAKGASLIWGVQQISAVTGPGIMAKTASVMPGAEGVIFSASVNSSMTLSKRLIRGLSFSAPTSASLATGSTHPLTLGFSQAQSISLATTVTTVSGSLLHMEGTNLATSFTDVNPAYTWTATAPNTYTSTAQFKFGSSSLHSTSNGGLQSGQSTDPLFQPGSSDFTWEGWIYTSNSGITQEIFSINNNAGHYNLLRINSSNKLFYQNWIPISITGSTSITTNTWHHVAVVRNGSTFTIYLDGSSEGTATSSAAIGSIASVAFTIGVSTTGSGPFQGWIDECRFTDVAKYTSNFTPTGPLTLP